MVKLTFKFNERKIRKKEKFKEEILNEMRCYSKKYGIVEMEEGIFEMDGEDALCLILDIATKIVLDNMKNIECFKKVELNVDGEIEDCIKETKEWLLQESCL